MMNDEKKQKKYYLQLKLRKKNKVEYITLLNDTLDEIDKITSISYTKERFLETLPHEFVSYILNNYDNADLIVTYKSGEFIKEIPTIQKEDRYMAYITRDEIEDIIFDKIINSKRINGKKITQGDFFVQLFDINYYYSKMKAEELLKMYTGQLGKRVVVQALQNMNLLKDKQSYVPKIEDVNRIQEKLFEIYMNSTEYLNYHSQITMEGFSVKDGLIRERFSNVTLYNVIPYLKELLVNPKAVYYIDKSFYPENFETNIEEPIEKDDFVEFMTIADKNEQIRNKIKRHGLYQCKVKDIYLEKITEYQLRTDKGIILEKKSET